MIPSTRLGTTVPTTSLSTIASPRLRRSVLRLLAAALCLPTTIALAQTAPAASTGNEEQTLAEVRRVDRANGKITLRHEAIRHLDMPSMTMVFQVRDSGLLSDLEPGAKVRFVAAKIDGAYHVIRIEKLP